MHVMNCWRTSYPCVISEILHSHSYTNAHRKSFETSTVGLRCSSAMIVVSRQPSQQRQAGEVIQRIEGRGTLRFHYSRWPKAPAQKLDRVGNVLALVATTEVDAYAVYTIRVKDREILYVVEIPIIARLARRMHELDAKL